MRDANRYVQLTQTGLDRLHAARRRCRVTVEEIAGDPDTPSINTVKKALRRGPVFVSTLERIWDFLQRRAAEQSGAALPHLVEGADYVFVEAAAAARPTTKKADDVPAERVGDGRKGWLSRQVPRPNRLFTGRREVLDRLHAALTAGPAAALVADPQALTGLGGIGKTQTAIAYIYEHWRDYDHVFWVSAETAEALDDGLAGLAEELNLLEDAAAPSAKGRALARMHDWLRRESGWLLVLDNTDDLETLAPRFPRHHAGGRLLLTTRARNTVRWAAPIPLVKFGREEGALLLLRRAGVLGIGQTLAEAPADAAGAAMDLCGDLDGLALALDQAGAYLAATPTSGVADYRARYRERGLELLDSATDPEHASVTVTFTLALEQMAAHSRYGAAAVEMVRLGAFLAPDAIPEAVFTAYHFEDAAPYEAVCAAVCAYSLAARSPENRTLTLHRLVQRVTRDSLSAEERRRWTERAVRAVADATPDFEYEDWSLCDLLLPQWRVCAQYIREGGIAEETAQAAYLLYQAGRYLRARALHEEAEANLRGAVGIGERVHGPEHRILADYLDDLACLYRVLDRRADAGPLHDRAVEIVEKTDGPESVSAAAKRHNRALLFVQYEEHDRAEADFLRALNIYERQPDPDRRLIATTMTQLAGVYRNLSRFEEAETYCRRALETYERLLGPDHIDIATGCNNLGLLYLTTGRYGEAEPLYRRALAINEKARGGDHPETGTVAWGLARVLWSQGRRAEADPLFRRAIQIYTGHFGERHARTARMLGSYAAFQNERRAAESG